jgi:hypothetical protein
MSKQDNCSHKSVTVLNVNITSVPAVTYINVIEGCKLAIKNSSGTCFPETYNVQRSERSYLFTSTALVLATFSRQNEAASKWRRAVARNVKTAGNVYVVLGRLF